MKSFIIAVMLITFAVCQPGTLRLSTESAALSLPTISQTLATTPTPSAGLAMDTSSSDAANVGTDPSKTAAFIVMPSTASSSSTSSISSTSSTRPSPYNDANNAWSLLQKLGGGCCSKCNQICGFGIRISGTNNYLTNRNTWFQFQNLGAAGVPNSNQIFTIGQNADCSWYISNRGSYLSTTTIYSGSWIGTASSIGLNERWYIERSGRNVYVQSAASQYNYWRASAAPNYFLGYSWAYGTRLTFEYFPCDKAYSWNW